jgi:PAS domain S-box-containing protein
MLKDFQNDTPSAANMPHAGAAPTPVSGGMSALDLEAHTIALAVETAGLGLWRYDLATGALDWNARLKTLYGLAADAPVSFEIFVESLHPDDREFVLDAFQAAVADPARTEFQVEHRTCGAEGRLRWLFGHGRILRNEDGVAESVVGTSWDITDRKIAEIERAESQRRLELAVRAHGVGIFDWYVKTGRVVWTEQEQRLFGLDPGSFEGTIEGWSQRVHPEDLASTQALLQAAMARRESTVEFAFRILLPDGEVKEIEGVASILYDAAGDAERMIGVNNDVTARKAADRLAAEQRRRDQRLQLAMAASGLGDVAWDAATNVTSMSDRAAEIYGLGERRSVPWPELERRVHPDDREATAATVQQAMASREPFDLEYRIHRPSDGELRWVAIRAQARFGEDGAVTGMAGVIRDVTEERTALERERMLAREVDHRAKNALAVVQSLVRLTPFTGQEAYVASITGRINAMARVHSLLSRNAWSGATIDQIVRQELEPFDTEGRFEIEGPSIELRLEAAQPLSLLIHELTTNAVKYGALSAPAGRVRVAWREQEDGDVELRWTETGGPPAPEPERRGFGSRLIQGAAGQLAGSVRKVWGEGGLECVLRIGALQTKHPIGPVAISPKTSTRAARLDGSRVLVVEDEALLAMELAEHLVRAGASVVGPASTLAAGIALARTEEFDCAVLDLNLGGASAEPLVQVLTALKLPFVVVTGYEASEVEAPVLLRKPVQHEALLAALSDQLAEARREGG